jgi:CRISPR-associated endonuclease/helicase Cas3
LFRRIAGIQVIIPALMKKDDEIAEKLSKIVENPENRDKTWDEIIDEVYGCTNQTERNNRKWTLKKILYQYSVNIPIFFWLEFDSWLIEHEFKGFYVLKVSDDQVDEILEYGIDSIKNLKMEEDFYDDFIL